MTTKSISKGVVKDIIIVVVGVLAIWIGLQAVFGTQNPFYVVSSGSMVPELEVYDVLVVQGNDPFEKVVVGDIIVFDRPSDHDRVIVHRVVAIIDEDPFTVRTQGDANPGSITGTDFPITEEEYIGTVAYVVPEIGFITRILTPPTNYIIIAIIIGVMILKQISKKKDKNKINLTETFDPSETETDKDSLTGNDGIDKIPTESAYTKSSKVEISDTEKKDVSSDETNSVHESLDKDQDSDKKEL